MSQDFQLAWPCPHLQTEHDLSLQPDRMSLVTRTPINGIGAMVVRANGVDVPTNGISSRAFLQSGLREPYLVSRGNTDLTITTQSTTKFVNLTPGYVRVQDLISVLQRSLGSSVVVGNNNGFLTLTEQLELGPFSTLRVTGTAASSIGFGYQWGSAGQVVVPPWSLFGLGDGGYQIRFSKPIRSGSIFSVTYPVAPTQCLRCRATGIENDVRTGVRGDARMVSDNNLLYQMCLKVILTNLRSNIYYPWYGSNIKASVGTKAQSGSALAIQQSVRTALSNLQNLQSAQSNFQLVSPKERLFAVDRVQVTESEVDPTVFLVDVAVRSYSSDPVSITIVYAAPGTYAIPGTNGLSLGMGGNS